jgi:hypothetical protein
MASVGVISTATAGALAVIALPGPWRYLAVAVAIAVGLWCVRRALRVQLVVTEARVCVDNYWTRSVIPWADVDGVGIAVKGLFPQPALVFRRADDAPVLATATPLRHSERQDLLIAVLALAPASVLRLDDAPAHGFLGTDRALSNRLRLWWLGEPRRPEPKAADQVWPEQPFGFSLLLAVVGLIAAALALVVGVSLLVGSITSRAPTLHYLVALLAVVAGCLGCAGLAVFMRRMHHRG